MHHSIRANEVREFDTTTDEGNDFATDSSSVEIIATKDVAGDGNPIYISWAGGGATSTQTAMQDDFFGGGDVGIALTTATV